MATTSLGSSTNPPSTLSIQTVRAANGNSSTPSLSWSSFTNTGFFNNGTNSIRASVNGTQMFSIDTATINLESRALAVDGSAATPAYSFSLDTDTGIYRPGSGDVYISNNGNISARFRSVNVSLHCAGTERFTVEDTRVIPVPDNTLKLGDSGFRWTTVYAANGTINTSHSSTKSNIELIDPTTVDVPQAVYYDRDGRRWMGYLNDSLPDIARPENDPTGNYENAVIGVLCAKLKQAFTEIDSLKQEVQTLKGV